jgi:hypothetical protein
MPRRISMLDATRLCFVLASAFAAACGGGGSDGDDDPGTPDGASGEALACDAVALCTTYQVKSFLGTVPAPAGGAVANGLYRLAYDVYPADAGEEWAGYHDDLDVLLVEDGSYNWAGFFRDSVGSITASGTTLAFHSTHRCLRGAEGDADERTTEYPYTATANELHLYEHVTTGTGEFDKLLVYRRADDPADVCATVDTEPASPADSAQCRVTNCACNFAVNDTVSECT